MKNTNDSPVVEKTATVLSFGAGTQSTAMLVLANQGKLGKIDFAVFADTQSEPKEVYDWLKKLQAWSKIPILIGTHGNLMEDVSRHVKGFTTVPLFTKKGIGMRQCTKVFKIDVISKTIRQRLGYAPRKRTRHKVKVMIGISTDEAQRMKPSRTKWIENVWPLIDLNLSRKDCVKIVEEAGLGTAPRSACIMCPYKRNDEWLHLKSTSPEEFEKACKWDEKMRTLKPGQEQFVHRSKIPLRDVVLVRKDDNDPDQDGIQEECEGMCGV